MGQEAPQYLDAQGNPLTARQAAAAPATLDAQGNPLAAGPHPEARIGAPSAAMPITLGDFQDNPGAALGRIGSYMLDQATDPKVLASLLAGYLGPKVIRGAMDMAGSAGPAIKALATDPDVVGLASPRAGHALRIAQRVGAAIQPAQEPAAPAAPETPLQVTQRIRAEYRAKATSPAETPPAPAKPSRSSRRSSTTEPRLTPEEQQAVEGLVAQGYDRPTVIAELLKHRSASTPTGAREAAAQELADRLGTPSDRLKDEAVAYHNAHGEWPKWWTGRNAKPTSD